MNVKNCLCFWGWLKHNAGIPVKNVLMHPYKIYLIKRYHRNIPILERKLKSKSSIKVVFFVMSLAMWKSTKLLRLMQLSDRYKPIVVLSPSLQHSLNEKRRGLQEMKEYFEKEKIEVIADYDCEKDIGYDVKTNIEPDIIFYQQPYEKVIQSNYRFRNFPQALICYIPYDFKTTAFRWGYDNILQNIAWKLFYPTSFHKQDAEKLSYVNGRNVIVTGYPIADEFLDEKRNIKDEWKISSSTIKRLIWAPHHSIYSYGDLNYSTFFRYCDFMLEVADKYKDVLQIAFKPHPWLLSRLYDFPGWGREKANAYYDKWNQLKYGFLAQNDYVDLFLTSDAMIHDCGSFSVEYHYTQKPVMFLTKSDHLKYESDFGRLAYDLHYKGFSETDIELFIKNVVLEGKDVMLSKRKKFFKDYLLPPNNKTVVSNIFNDIQHSL